MIKIGIFEKEDKYFRETCEYLNQKNPDDYIIYTVSNVLPINKSINHINIEEVVKKTLKGDKGDLFLRSKDFFINNVDYAIVEVLNDNYMGLSFATSFINNMRNENFRTRICVISKIAISLKDLFQKMAVDEEKSLLESRLYSQEIIFSDKFELSIFN